MDTNNPEEKITYLSEDEAAEMNRKADELANTPDVKEVPGNIKAFKVFALIVAIVFFISFALGLGVVGVFGRSFSDYLNGVFGQGSKGYSSSLPISTNNNAGSNPVKPLSNDSAQSVQDTYTAVPVSTQQNSSDGIRNTTNPNDSFVQQTPAPTPVPTPNAKVVTLSIFGEEGDNYVILDKTEFAYSEGATVYDVTKMIKDTNGILVATRGAGEFIYVRGINNLFERDAGGNSGWIYAVNGVPASVGCGTYKLKGGDEIVWKYSKDGGKDIGWAAQ